MRIPAAQQQLDRLRPGQVELPLLRDPAESDPFVLYEDLSCREVAGRVVSSVSSRQ